MPGHIHLKWYCQFEKTFDVYLKGKNQLHSQCLFGDIKKIFKHLILGTLGMSGYTHQKW